MCYCLNFKNVTVLQFWPTNNADILVDSCVFALYIYNHIRAMQRGWNPPSRFKSYFFFYWAAWQELRELSPTWIWVQLMRSGPHCPTEKAGSERDSRGSIGLLPMNSHDIFRKHPCTEQTQVNGTINRQQTSRRDFRVQVILPVSVLHLCGVVGSSTSDCETLQFLQCFGADDAIENKVCVFLWNKLGKRAINTHKDSKHCP